MKKLLLFLLIIPNVLMAETLVKVKTMTEQELLETVSMLGKTTFKNGKIQVYNTEGQLLIETVIEESTIIVNVDDSSVTITDNDGQEETVGITTSTDDANAKIMVYPNPATDVLYLSGIEIGMPIRLISLQGQTILSITSKGNSETLQVNQLQKGAYLLQVGNNILKLLKQ